MNLYACLSTYLLKHLCLAPCLFLFHARDLWTLRGTAPLRSSRWTPHRGRRATPARTFDCASLQAKQQPSGQHEHVSTQAGTRLISNAVVKAERELWVTADRPSELLLLLLFIRRKWLLTCYLMHNDSSHANIFHFLREYKTSILHCMYLKSRAIKAEVADYKEHTDLSTSCCWVMHAVSTNVHQQQCMLQYRHKQYNKYKFAVTCYHKRNGGN